jgi:hypothetical protein
MAGFGGQVGKNWQVNSWVVGLEADGQWTDAGAVSSARRGWFATTLLSAQG